MAKKKTQPKKKATEPAESIKPTVWLFGDVHFDTAICDLPPNDQIEHDIYWKNQKQVIERTYRSGVWLIEDILKKTIGESINLITWDKEIEIGSSKYDWCPRSIYRVSPFRKKPNSEANSEDNLVYRISENLGWFRNGGGAVPSRSTQTRDFFNELVHDPNKFTEFISQKGEMPHLVIIYDRNNGFRQSQVAQKIVERFKQTTNEPNSLPIFLWARSSPFKEDSRGELGQFLCNEAVDSTVALVRGECLRKSGVNLLQDGSVEQFVGSIFDSKDNEVIRELMKFSHTAYYFRESVLHLSSKLPNHSSYHFCPHSVDEMWQPNMSGGQMRGYTTIMCASIAISLCESLVRLAGKNTLTPEGIRETLLDSEIDKLRDVFMPTSAEVLGETPPVVRGLQLGQVAGTYHYREGYSTIGDMSAYLEKQDDCKEEYRIESPIPDLLHRIRMGTIEKGELEIGYDHRLSSLLFDQSTNESLSRVDSYLQQKSHSDPGFRAEDHLIRVVQDGLKRVVEPHQASNIVRAEDSGSLWPAPSIFCPHARFGIIKTCDRTEIESFMSMYTLLHNYFHHGSKTRPFSVAVFGPPGSGKSFAIKQIVREVDERSADNALEYNISQFSRPDDLMAVFHHIHDKTTARIVPLVILDEFDCPLNNHKLGWLKYFLAPTQDGTFKDRGDVFKIGKAIFLFAGGTAHTFQSFVEDQSADAEFRAAKGPDFVSRLRGHLDIQSINDEDKVTNQLRMRRATLLRSLLKLVRKDAVNQETNRINIEPEIVRAFLSIKTFKHGVRSMEAILEMSKVIDGWIRKSSLPMDDQLDMHVNSETFMKIVNQ